MSYPPDNARPRDLPFGKQPSETPFDKKLPNALPNELLQLLHGYRTELIVILDDADSICYVNPAVQRILGYCPSMVIGRSIWGICSQWYARIGAG